MEQQTGVTTPTDESTQAEQTESKPATAEQSVPETENAAQPNAETGGDKKPPQDASTADDNAEGEKPAKLSRYQRMQRKNARLSTVIAEQAARIQELEKRSQGEAPKATDYAQGEYDPAYIAETAAFKAAQRLGKNLDEREARAAQDKIAEARAEAAQDFLERAEELKTSIPDFDQAFEDLVKAGGKFEPHIIEELHDSENGPLLAYHLAKQPHLVASLNQLSPRDAAREIGRIEAKLSLPQPKKQTKAPPPINPPSGGAAPTKSLHELAKSDDISAFVKAREAEEKAKKR